MLSWVVRIILVAFAFTSVRVSISLPLHRYEWLHMRENIDKEEDKESERRIHKKRNVKLINKKRDMTRKMEQVFLKHWYKRDAKKRDLHRAI